MNTEIFHLLEIDLPLGDGTFKRFWYGSVSCDDGIIKLTRVEDLKSWENLIFERSREIVGQDPVLKSDKDVVKIDMGIFSKGYQHNRKKPFIFM